MRALWALASWRLGATEALPKATHHGPMPLILVGSLAALAWCKP